jgi:hypothetical protein
MFSFEILRVLDREQSKAIPVSTGHDVTAATATPKIASAVSAQNAASSIAVNMRLISSSHGANAS